MNAVYKGCTREAQGMLTLEKVVQPSFIRCTPLVHDAKSPHWACDDKCLAGAGLANPGGVLSLDVALAIGCGPQQALGADPPGLPPTGAARRLAKEPDVLDAGAW